jgi:uncharacterized protein YqeY
MYMDTKKLINQNNCIMKNKNIIEVEIQEIKKELQDDQRSHVNESGGEQLEQLCTMYAGVQKQNLAPKTEEKLKIINKWMISGN